MNDLFLRACRGEAVERLPVWIMRQAGRYLPEYRRVREGTDFLTLCRTPELVTEVTLQPVDIVGVDAAIVAMGAELRFVKGDGPCFEQPIRSREDIARLRVPDVDESLGYVFDALRMVRRELSGRVPVIGFGGTPWTLAAYLVEGGTSKSFARLLGWSYRDPAGLGELLRRIAETSIAYLRGQIAAGAQAIQLFDTWAGLLDSRRFRAIALPPLLAILEALRDTVPLIYYAKGSAHLLPDLGRLPVDVLSLDWRLPLNEVRRRVGDGLALQGNLDPGALLSSREDIRARVRQLVDDGRGGPHIANLGHGILPMTPVDNARVFVEAVKELSADRPQPPPLPAGDGPPPPSSRRRSRPRR